MKKFLPFLISLFCINVLLAQTSPVANNDTFSLNKNNPVSFPVLSNDFDLDGDPLALSVIVLPLHGTASISANQINFSPALNYVGTDSLIYVICDTTNRCDTALVFITILPANNPPVALSDTFTIIKNALANLPVLSNDYDVDGDPLSLSILTAPANGTATVSGNQVNYQPNLNYVGNDFFVYAVCDTANICDTATVFIIISGGSSKPVAQNDAYTIPEDLAASLPVLSNDYDADGDVLTITILIPPSNGTASVNGSQVNYTPNSSYFGVDSFVYVICDSSNLCDTATVYIIVSGSNSAPVAVDDNFTFSDTLTFVSLPVLTNDYDSENDSFSLSTTLDIDGPNSLGSISIDAAARSLIFSRNGVTCGTESFEYVICDYSMCDTGTVTITVTCPDNIFLTEGFSPDGDGTNDKLVFTRLEYFAPARLKVFNRYGTMVYDNEDYKNDWDGTHLESGKPLPDGTYFYILELTDGRKYNNYLIINR